MSKDIVYKYYCIYTHDDNVMSFLFGMYLYRNLDAEKLEEYGIHRGAQDTNDDYTTEDGELTLLGKLKKMREMLPGLPKEMQEIISAALNDIHSQTAYPQDEAYWASFDEGLMEINEMNQGTINIEDIVDY